MQLTMVLLSQLHSSKRCARARPMLPLVVSKLPQVVRKLPLVRRKLPQVRRKLPLVVRELPLVMREQRLPLMVRERPVNAQVVVATKCPCGTRGTRATPGATASPRGAHPWTCGATGGPTISGAVPSMGSW